MRSIKKFLRSPRGGSPFTRATIRASWQGRYRHFLFRNFLYLLYSYPLAMNYDRVKIRSQRGCSISAATKIFSSRTAHNTRRMSCKRVMVAMKRFWTEITRIVESEDKFFSKNAPCSWHVRLGISAFLGYVTCDQGSALFPFYDQWIPFKPGPQRAHRSLLSVPWPMLPIL